MGLDQYLYARRYMSNSDFGSLQKWSELYDKVSSATNIKDILSPELQGDSFNSGFITFKVGYWRKENAIHNWFVLNCQDGNDDCGEHWVGREQLAKLKEACDEVLADPTKADEILPTADGFFFGTTDYDDWYLSGLERTSKLIGHLLEKADDSWDFAYHSSW